MSQFPEILAIVVGVPLALGLLVLWIWMLIDCLKNKKLDARERLIWVIVIVLVKIVGAVLYYFMEYRPRRAAGAD